MTVVNFETQSGKVTPDTRDEFAGAIKSLPDGWHKAIIEDVKRGYTSTRYKYYFAHVLETILMTCGHHFKVLEGSEWRSVRNTAEIHEFFKIKYNPAFIQGPGGMYISANTTTALSDKEFINLFEEAVIIEFSDPPYGCEFMGREEWAAWMKNGRK
jgi:hypothetical protein